MSKIFINFASAWSIPDAPFGKTLFMAKQRILYVSPGIAPYLPASEISSLGRDLPVAMHNKKYEVRTFTPNFGAVNERRNQLHEVIRLSGLNISINDADHPMIVKVASMQPSRIQVYFIDNDDYFQKLDTDEDAYGSNREDNDERILFFSHATADTARKLRWDPNIVHTSGWIGAMVPLYLRKVFTEGDAFDETKLIYSVLDEAPLAPLSEGFFSRLVADGVNPSDLDAFREYAMDVNLLHRMAIANSDAVVFNNRTPDPALVEYARSLEIPILMLNPEEENGDKYHQFYQEILNK